MYCQVHLISQQISTEVTFTLHLNLATECFTYTSLINVVIFYIVALFLVYRLCWSTSVQVVSDGGRNLYVAGTCASLSDTKLDYVLLDEQLRYFDKCFMSGKQGRGNRLWIQVTMMKKNLNSLCFILKCLTLLLHFPYLYSSIHMPTFITSSHSPANMSGVSRAAFTLEGHLDLGLRRLQEKI